MHLIPQVPATSKVFVLWTHTHSIVPTIKMEFTIVADTNVSGKLLKI